MIKSPRDVHTGGLDMSQRNRWGAASTEEEWLKSAYTYARDLENDGNGRLRVALYPSNRMGVWTVELLARYPSEGGCGVVDYSQRHTYPGPTRKSLGALIFFLVSQTDFKRSRETIERRSLL